MYEGVYVLASEFYPHLRCPENIPWWLDAAPESCFFDQLAELGEAANDSGVRAYRIEFTGTLSPPGAHGHLGAYPRPITVQRLHAVEVARDCLP